MKGSPATWRLPFETATGERIESFSPVAGGDIAHAYRLDLESGQRAFLKHYPGYSLEPNDFLTLGDQERAVASRASGPAPCEARRLEWLRAAQAPIRIARVLAHGADWLALEWIERSAPGPAYDRILGEGLAALHAAAPDRFGLCEDNWIGRLPQSNTPSPPDHDAPWTAFLASQRLAPLARRARDQQSLSRSLIQDLDRLIETLAERVGPEEPPSRLHGDLWSGNVMPDEHGSPCLFDPACYGGAREMDLAMMRLFGGFGPGVFDAYAHAFPLASGAEARIPLYQVYPLLVHVCLFGAGYARQLHDTVRLALV